MFFCLVGLSTQQIGYYVWDTACFDKFITGTGSITVANFPAGGAAAASLNTLTFSQPITPTGCIIGLTSLQMTTSGNGFDFSVIPVSPCTSTGIVIEGTRGTQTTISVVIVSYLANSFSALEVGIHTASNAAASGSVSINIPTTASNSNGAVGEFFVIGYQGNMCGGGSCDYLGYDYNNLNFGSGAATVTINNRNNSQIKRLDISYLIYESNTLSNTSNSYRLARFDTCGGSRDIKSGPGNVQDCNPSGFPNTYLANNFMWGIVSWRQKTSSRPTFSIQALYTGAPYNFRYSQITNTQFSDVKFGFFILYEKACPAATFPAALYLSVDRSNCLAACPVRTYSDTCKHCFTCHVTCRTCNDDTSTACLSCESPSRTAAGAFAPTSTCPCSTGYAEYGTVQYICNPCHSSCVTCSVGGNWNACLTCNEVSRTLTGTSCPCMSNHLNVAGVCQPCGTNCATCTGVVANCATCTATNLLAANYPRACAATCPSGQYLTTTPQVCGYCNSNCATCVTTSTNCLSCDSPRFLYTTYCANPCPSGFYGDIPTRTCLACDPNCPTCTSYSICTRCVNPLYLLNGFCYTTCPQEYFGRTSPSTWQCVECNGNCVNVTNFTLQPLNYDDIPSTPLLVKIHFSYPIVGFSNFYILEVPFTYTIQNFTLTADRLNYSFLIVPKKQIAFGVVTLRSVAKTSAVIGELNTGMHQSVWSLSTAFNFSYLLGAFGRASTFLGAAANTIYNSSVIPTEVRLLASLGLPSLQLTSCILYTDFPLPKHFYDGLRILGLGNHFTVPPWELNPRNRSFFNSYNVTGPQGRMLLASPVPTRLSRTSLSPYFHANVYVQLVVLLAIIIGNALIQLLHRHNILGPTASSAGWMACDFAHQYWLMYLYINSMIVLQAFQVSSLQGIISLAVCIVANVQFFAYQLYRFYDFSRLKNVAYGQAQFQQFSIKFSHLVRYLRFQQSTSSKCFLLQPWLNPQYYHVMSSVKKSLMMFGFALFAGMFQAQIAIVVLLQLCEAVRAIVLRPFASILRNIGRITIQLTMAMVFGLVLYLGFLFKQIQQSSESALLRYNQIGWVLLIACLAFNVYFLTALILGIVDRIKTGDRTMLIDHRKQYYYRELANAKDNEVGHRTIQECVRKGNLNERDKELPDIDVRIEAVSFYRHSGDVLITLNRCLELRMNSAGCSFNEVNNTVQTKKFSGKANLSRLPKNAVSVVNQLLKEKRQLQVKTFTNVKQSKCKFGQPVSVEPSYQQVKSVSTEGVEQFVKLCSGNMLQMFPLTKQLLPYFG